MKAIKKYLIALLIGFIGVGLIIWLRDIFSQTELSAIFHILTDAFFAVGVFITGAGLIVFTSNEGAFDLLAYGLSSFADMFRKKSNKKYETFYDYKESRADKKTGFGFLLICGVFFLTVSFVMLFLYYQYS